MVFNFSILWLLLLKIIVRKLITNKDGKYLEENDLYMNKQLGNTLRVISKNASDFYNGEIAKNLTSDIQKHGGLFLHHLYHILCI